MADRKDPYASFNFVVELDGQVVAGFKEISGLSSRIEVIEYREGGEKFFPNRKLPGRVTYANVILKIGITDDRTLFDWHLEWVKGDGAAKRKLMRVVLQDGAGNEKLSWKIREAWPAAWTGPTFNAEANLVAIQTLEIAHEGIELE